MTEENIQRTEKILSSDIESILPHLLSPSSSNRIQAAKLIMELGQSGISAASKYFSTANAITQQLRILLNMNYNSVSGDNPDVLLTIPMSDTETYDWLAELSKTKRIYVMSDGHNGTVWHIELAELIIKCWERRMNLLRMGDQVGNGWNIKEVKRGGMGQVCICEHNLTSGLRALKTIRPEFIRTPEAWNRFGWEIATWFQLGRHPYIVGIESILSAETQPWFVMEYVPSTANGNSLRELIHKGISLEDSLKIAQEICSAMIWATHQIKGFVHRDLKPENILINEMVEARVSDFGLSKCGSPQHYVHPEELCSEKSPNCVLLTRKGEIMGTPPYMSPEQCRGDRFIDNRTDIYSFGCILFEMITGQWPFQGESAGEIIHKHLTASPPDLKAIKPVILPAIQMIIVRCLAKNPEDRFPDFESVNRALKEIYKPKKQIKIDEGGQPINGVGLAAAAIQMEIAGFPLQATELMLLATKRDYSQIPEQLKLARTLLNDSLNLALGKKQKDRWVRPFEFLGVDPGQVLCYGDRRAGWKGALAIKLLTPLIETNFQRLMSLFLIGCAYGEVGRINEAVEVLTEVRRIAGHKGLGMKAAILIRWLSQVNYKKK